MPIINRSGAAPKRTFTLVLASPTNATITQSTATVMIGASGQSAVASPGVSAPADVLVGEADGFVDLAVTLSAPGQNTVTVNYATAQGTAGSGNACNALFVGVSGTLTFVSGVTTQVVRVDLLNCNVAGLHSFTFNLASPTNATIIRTSTRVGIVGDAAAVTTPSLFAHGMTVDNGVGTVNVPVLLGGVSGGASTNTVTVAYATHDGTATAGSDYGTTTGSLTFPAGATVENVSVPIINRSGAAPKRTFTLVLASPTNATITQSTATVMIGASGQSAVASPGVSAPADVLVGEADGFVDLAVTLSAPGQNTVTVNYATAEGTAGSGNACNALFVGVSGTLTFVSGVTTQVVRVDLLNCNVAGLIRSRSILRHRPTQPSPEPAPH